MCYLDLRVWIAILHYGSPDANVMTKQHQPLSLCGAFMH